MHKDRKNRRAFDRSFCLGALCFASVLMAACGGLSSSESRDRVEQDSQSLYVKTGTIWNVATIPVCWEKDGDEEAKGWVRDAVARTWETQAAVSFGGWAKCEPSSRGIWIDIEDDLPQVDALGSQLDGFRADGSRIGMRLNFKFNWKSDWDNFCHQEHSPEYCIRAIAVHEFGHALGFSHEQLRPDMPTSCTSDDPNFRAGESGDSRFGDFDATSIMSYCNPNGWNNKGNLTAADIAGAGNYYGGPHSISSVSWSNRVAAFYKDAQGRAWGRIFNGTNLSYQSIGDNIASDPVAVGCGANQLDVFVRKGDGYLWHRASNDGGASFGVWERLGDRPIVGDPAVVFQTSRIHVVARGADDSLLHFWAERGQGWTLEIHEEKVASALSVVSWGVGRLDIFYLDSNAVLGHTWYDNGWHNESRKGAKYYGPPSAVSWGPGRIDVFLRGQDDAVWHERYDGSWLRERLGGSIAGNPAAVSWGPNRLDVFARRAGDGALLHQYYSDASWKPSKDQWDSLGGAMGGSPACSSAGPNKLDVFVRNAASQLAWRWWDGNNLNGEVVIDPYPIR